MPVTTAVDFGQRPALDSLGPMHWHPRPAEPWSLAGADQKVVSLRDYAGRPVVVVFYLGFGCLHCVEQLKAIEPAVADLDAARHLAGGHQHRDSRAIAGGVGQAG